MDHIEGWVLKNWCFQTVVLEKTLESPLDSKEIKQVNSKENQSWIFIGMTVPMLWLKWCLPTVAGKDWRQEKKGMTEDEMVGWHHWLDGHVFEQALGIGDQQGSLACCSRWGWKSRTLLKWLSSSSSSIFISIELVMPSNHLILCHLLLPSVFPSNSRQAPFEPKHWNSRSNEYSGLIFLRIDWFDLLAVQGTLKSLLQHHNLKAPILQHSAFNMVHLSHLYLTTGKTIALTMSSFVGKVISLLLICCLNLS